MSTQEYVGKVVVFTKSILEMESYAEPGMRGRIVRVDEEDTHRKDIHDHMYKFYFDYSEFDEYNRRFETANYYGHDGIPNKTAREAGHYQEVEKIYFGTPELWPFENYFEPIDKKQKALVDLFNKSDYTDYVAWLESQITVD